jgi:cyclic lactone autoinducer peptide
MKSKVMKQFASSFCTILLALAPVLAVNMQSTIFWGEPEIPESLKN